MYVGVDNFNLVQMITQVSASTLKNPSFARCLITEQAEGEGDLPVCAPGHTSASPYGRLADRKCQTGHGHVAEKNEPARPGKAIELRDSGETEEVAEVHGIVRVRNVPLILLTIFASVFILDWAQPVLVPLVLGLIVFYGLSPVVDRLEKFAIPRGLSAAALLLIVVGGVGATAVSLQDEAVSLIETLPEAVKKFRSSARAEWSGSGATIEKVQKAADEINRVTEAAAPAAVPRGITRVQVEKPKFDIRTYLWTNALAAAAAISSALIVLFLAYFLLASGDSFRRKWVKMSGPTLSSKRITVEVLNEIDDQIKRYLGVQVLTSAIVGVTSGLAFWAIGLENAAVWGVAAGVLNLVPYLGAIVTTSGTALVAFLQFGTVGMALAVAGISIVINSLEGAWLTPWLAGRASRMNSVVVFSGLLFWGWLWGGWGLVLGLPIMMVVKAVCDHVEDLTPIGEFMGSESVNSDRRE
jgi:predicted PurR-regulated permease PerM